MKKLNYLTKMFQWQFSETGVGWPKRKWWLALIKWPFDIHGPKIMTDPVSSHWKASAAIQMRPQWLPFWCNSLFLKNLHPRHWAEHDAILVWWIVGVNTEKQKIAKLWIFTLLTCVIVRFRAINSAASGRNDVIFCVPSVTGREIVFIFF